MAPKHRPSWRWSGSAKYWGIVSPCRLIVSGSLAATRKDAIRRFIGNYAMTGGRHLSWPSAYRKGYRASALHILHPGIFDL